MSEDRLHVRRGQPVERGQGRALEIAPGGVRLRSGVRVRAGVRLFERTLSIRTLTVSPESFIFRFVQPPSSCAFDSL